MASTLRKPQSLSRGARLGAMLLVASIALPILALIGILIFRRYVFVHYETHTMLLWLLLDGILLAVGLVLTENDAVRPKRRRRSRR